jgi:hypothetical protein
MVATWPPSPAALAHDTELAPTVAVSARNGSGHRHPRDADEVVAQVEVQAGPHRWFADDPEAAEELGLEPGVRAVATVKAPRSSSSYPAGGVSRRRAVTAGVTARLVALACCAARHCPDVAGRPALSAGDASRTTVTVSAAARR